MVDLVESYRVKYLYFLNFRVYYILVIIYFKLYTLIKVFILVNFIRHGVLNMSLLNGNNSSEILVPEKSPFGELYEVSAGVKLVGAMDCACLTNQSGEYLVAVGTGKLCVYKIGSTLILLSELDGLGDSRQISVSGNFAYVSARADGLFIIDLTDINNPIIAYRMDTLELATGVCSADGLLAVTNRHMGCEIYDVRNPYNPLRIGDFLCGEAQSVWLYDKFALTGDWINRQVCITDISADNFGKSISHFSVDGFADGVCVYKTLPDAAHPGGRVICLTASGHHSSKLINRRRYQDYSYVTAEMIAEGYGAGHRVTVTDITDIENPEFISEIVAPPMFGGVDSWRVFVGNGKCWYTDSMNGLFEIDLADLTAPRFTRNFKLACNARQYQTPPSIQIQCGSVTGMSIVNGKNCVVGGDEVFVLKTENNGKLVLPYCNAINNLPKVNREIKDERFYDGNVHSFASFKDKIYCACGNDGIITLDLNGKILNKRKIVGYCCDVIAYNDLIVCAEGSNGVAVYAPDDMREFARFYFGTAKPVRELICCGEYIGVLVGSKSVGAIKICKSDDGKVLVGSVGELRDIGMLYYRHLSRTLVGDKLLAVPLSGGPRTFAVSERGLKEAPDNLNLTICPFEEGACGYRGGIIVLRNGNYYFIKSTTAGGADPIAVDCARLKGLPFVCRDKLVVLNRVRSTVEIIDVENPEKPKFIRGFKVDGHPEFAAEVNGKILIADGFGGLINIFIF